MSRPTLFILLLLASKILAPSVQANENGTFCVQLFKEMNQQIELGFVLSQTQRKIAAYFTDATLTPQERAAKVFEAVVSDRIRLLAEPEAQQVMRFLKERVIRKYNETGKLISAEFIDGLISKSKIQLNIPIEIRNSILEYTILIHELEHYIQTLAVSHSAQGKWNLFFSNLVDFVDLHYEREKGAMLVEFEFMNSIPMSARYEVFQEISQNESVFESNTLKILYLLLAPNGTTPLDHVAFQHSVGRYNKKNIEADYQQIYRGVLLLISSAAAPLITMKAIQDLHNKCSNLKNQHLFKLCQFLELPHQP